jgi:hypothetical protein
VAGVVDPGPDDLRAAEPAPFPVAGMLQLPDGVAFLQEPDCLLSGAEEEQVATILRAP